MSSHPHRWGGDIDFFLRAYKSLYYCIQVVQYDLVYATEKKLVLYKDENGGNGPCSYQIFLIF